MQGLEKGPGMGLDWGNQKNHKLLEVVCDMGLWGCLKGWKMEAGCSTQGKRQQSGKAACRR